MCISLALEIIFLVVVTSVCYDPSYDNGNLKFGCCYKAIFVAFIILFLSVSVIIYGINYADDIAKSQGITVELGWLFGLAAGALACADLRAALISGFCGVGNSTTILNK